MTAATRRGRQLSSFCVDHGQFVGRGARVDPLSDFERIRNGVQRLGVKPRWLVVVAAPQQI